MPSDRRKCANMRTIFKFPAEKAEIADCLAERSQFELSGDFANSLYIESKPASLAPHSVALYEHLQHLVSTLIDLQHALVAIELFNHRSLQITCTAEYL